MIALALTEGVSTIGLFGIDYQVKSEYVMQRGCCEAWLMYASALGVRIVLPEQCSLLAAPKLLYGYESHDEVTGIIKPEYTKYRWKEDIKPIEGPMRLPAVPTPELAKEIKTEEMDYPRPDWALGPLPESGNGNHKEGVVAHE